MILNTLQARLPPENIGTSKGQTLQKPKTNDLSPPPGTRGASTLSNVPPATGKTSHLKMKIFPIPQNRLNIQTHEKRMEIFLHESCWCTQSHLVWHIYLSTSTQTLQNELHPVDIYWKGTTHPGAQEPFDAARCWCCWWCWWWWRGCCGRFWSYMSLYTRWWSQARKVWKLRAKFNFPWRGNWGTRRRPTVSTHDADIKIPPVFNQFENCYAKLFCLHCRGGGLLK